MRFEDVFPECYLMQKVFAPVLCSIQVKREALRQLSEFINAKFGGIASNLKYFT